MSVIQKAVPNFRRSSLLVLYIVGFIFALRTALPSYVNSSFLSQITAEKLVGIIYAIASILTIIGFFAIPWILSRLGNYRTVIGLSAINTAVLAVLALANNPLVLLVAFLIAYVVTILIGYCFDVFVEHYSRNVETGRIRSFYLTSINIAWIFAPLASAYLSGENSFQKVFLISAFIMAIVVLVATLSLRDFKDTRYKHFKLLDTVKEIADNKNIRSITMANLLLHIFYSWMIIYTPIYLNQYLGFSWQQIGVAFTIMLVPFILVQVPLGWLADKKLGEKELLCVGFLIMAISTCVLTFMSAKSFLLWGVMLFITRVGAAVIEIMTETYFFKKINTENTNLISVFRMTSPIAYVIGPLLATWFLSYFGMNYMFVALGVIMLLGIKYSLAIEDTR
ncbi:MAG: MFS transporter [Candidatus Paceibacterota bacterium]|jgi:MFS family permease